MQKLRRVVGREAGNEGTAVQRSQQAVSRHYQWGHIEAVASVPITHDFVLVFQFRVLQRGQKARPEQRAVLWLCCILC